MRYTLVVFCILLNHIGICQVPDTLPKSAEKRWALIDSLAFYHTRSELSHWDSLILQKISKKLARFRVEVEPSYLDSLTILFSDPKTPDILAQEIADSIGSIDSRWAISWLMDNIFVGKTYHNYQKRQCIGLGLSGMGGSPSLNTILNTNRFFEAYDIIFNSDFLLEHEEKLKGSYIAFGHNEALYQLFIRHRFYKGMIEEYYYIFKEKSPRKAALLEKFLKN